MRHRLATMMINTIMLGVVLVALAGPLLAGQLLSSSQSGALGAQQLAPVGKSITVLPNTNDFAEYASFNPRPIEEPLFYQSSVTFSAFAGQQASYNGLLSVYNPSAEGVTVGVEVGNLSGDLENSEVWVSFVPEGKPAVSLLTSDAVIGATQLQVADSSGLLTGPIVVNGQVVQATPQSGTAVNLTNALTKAAKIGDKVYMGAAYYAKNNKPTVGQTQSLTLAPGARASLNLIVATDSGAERQQAVMPIVIRAE